MGKEIYLDNAATTRVDERVAEKVKEALLKGYGNASSQHSIGRKARAEVEKARKEIADFIGAEPEEIFFTSGGTEANNLALRGLARASPSKKHIITSVIEHPCILETCRDLERAGFKIDYVKVDKEGIVDVKEIERRITKNTLVVSIMYVNNEIGTVQPIEEIGEICLDKGVCFHTDAVQAFTKLPINVGKMNLDLMSVSGHKFRAPKGIGFLYVKKGTSIVPVMTGGGQERGLRSGTENVPGILGLTEAIKLGNNNQKIMKVRNEMIKELLEIPGTRINGSLKKRIFNNINVSFYGIEGESLMLMLDKEGIFVSTGSACASSKLSESHVLKAIGVDDMYIHGSLRLTLDESSGDDLKFIVKKIKEKVERLREISPFKLNFEEANEKKI
jgi:cysteine desulfurase